MSCPRCQGRLLETGECWECGWWQQLEDGDGEQLELPESAENTPPEQEPPDRTRFQLPEKLTKTQQAALARHLYVLDEHGDPWTIPIGSPAHPELALFFLEQGVHPVPATGIRYPELMHNALSRSAAEVRRLYEIFDEQETPDRRARFARMVQRAAGVARLARGLGAV